MAAPPIAPAADTTHVIAPHSALAAGPRGLPQGISAPPAACASTSPATITAVAAVAHDSAPSSSAAGMTKDPKMLFSDLYKSTKSPLARLRPQAHVLCADPEFDADLVSRDKTKQKEAVKKFLANKVRNDWEFRWPPAEKTTPANDGTAQDAGACTGDATQLAHEEAPDSVNNTAPSHDKTLDDNDDDDEDNDDLDDDNDDDDNASVYSTVSEDASRWRPRLEWWSDLSDDEPCVSPSAYRFDTPDAVGPTLQAAALAKRAKRRREIREEQSWNSGLACFNARRDAWTGAKVARVKPKPQTPSLSPTPSRRMSFFRFASPTSPPLSPVLPLSPTATHTSADTTVVASSDGESKEPAPAGSTSLYPIETLLPLAPPILPPANPMRASILPNAYASIYDRIVVHSMTPSCPINLADILRSCVVGWKRDGEWPPRAAEVAPVMAARKKKRETPPSHQRQSSSGRRMSFGFLGRRESAGDVHPGEAHDDGAKGLRKSIQRALGIGHVHERSGSTVSGHPTAA